MLVLKFDVEQLAYDLCDTLVDAADEIINIFMNDLNTSLRANDFEEQKAIFDMAAGMIIASCVSYAESILESYGRGSLMDKDNPALEEYMNSEFWNPERNSSTIVGRPKGTYTNIFGETTTSKGKMAGLYLEHIVSPIAPSYAIQNAEKRLYQITSGGGYGFRILEQYANEFFEHLDTSKYFYNEDRKV